MIKRCPMLQSARKKYPIGLQTFSELRLKNYLYIDKTEYVYRMTHADAKYVFLSRPCWLILKDGASCSRAWPWNNWKRNGWNILCCTLI